LTKKLLDQIKERKQRTIKLNMGKFKGEEVSLNSSSLTILKPQNITPDIIRISAINSLAGKNTVIQYG
ncbi:unnamed protein product, partial [marine sediment metagenome]